MILVDTSVLFDLVLSDPQWEAWSTRALALAAAQDTIAINATIYAELSSHYDTIEYLDAVLDTLELNMVDVPKAALFLAGHAFRRYRRSGGSKTNVLADFFIGAHAAVTGSVLLTRDARHISTYFPTVSLMSPKTE
ncbi:MAG TPA: type II toxin-antitoxin system VapC family toxin [Rhizomicrobium sp.]|jgi:hypothetical protein|nr:type II toxin-antitoxin system VapC family toxin [Rhizomicrobium sp.]